PFGSASASCAGPLWALRVQLARIARRVALKQLVDIDLSILAAEVVILLGARALLASLLSARCLCDFVVLRAVRFLLRLGRSLRAFWGRGRGGGSGERLTHL